MIFLLATVAVMELLGICKRQFRRHAFLIETKAIRTWSGDFVGVQVPLLVMVFCQCDQIRFGCGQVGLGRGEDSILIQCLKAADLLSFNITGIAETGITVRCLDTFHVLVIMVFNSSRFTTFLKNEQNYL